MKTAYCISPGLQLPGESFTWRNTPEIISHPMLWEAMRGLSSGIVFRVRTDKNVGDKIDGGDRIESAVGIIDSTTRWRACFAIIRSSLAALRIPDVAEPCWQVYGMMTAKHQATVQMSERQQLATQIRMAIDKLPGDDPRAAYESSVAAMCMRLAFTDSDYEVAQIVPFGPVYMANCSEEHTDDRLGTVEVMASSTFLCEAYNRMSEKVPDWLYMPMPVTHGVAPETRSPTARPEPRTAPQEPAEAEED